MSDNPASDRPLRIFFSVGEPSGDTHGANLIRELHRRHPDTECVGYGGPKMEEAGMDMHENLTALAVMWILRVLLNIHKFWGLVSRADRYFRHHRPDAVVLIDYPGFNWWIARRARRHGIPVFYYSPPQLWGWAGWRIKKMRKFVDHVLCCLPFEEKWFRDRGVQATFVGHPFFDEVTRHEYDRALIDKLRADGRPIVTILPGSRTQEVLHNFPTYLAAIEKVAAEVGDIRPVVAAYKPKQAEWIQQQIDQSETSLPIEVFVGKTPELMAAADVCMSTSGSVSLELLYHIKPTVILYRISPGAYRVQGFFRKVRYITLVNLLGSPDPFPESFDPCEEFDPKAEGAEWVLFPEYLTCKDRSTEIAEHITQWLADRSAMDAKITALDALKRKVASGGSTRRTVDYLLDHLLPETEEIPKRRAA